MKHIHLAPSSTHDIVVLLAIIIVLLLPAFVLVAIVMMQIALIEQLLARISILSLVVFII